MAEVHFELKSVEGGEGPTSGGKVKKENKKSDRPSLQPAPRLDNHPDLLLLLRRDKTGRNAVVLGAVVHVSVRRHQLAALERLGAGLGHHHLHHVAWQAGWWGAGADGLLGKALQR